MRRIAALVVIALARRGCLLGRPAGGGRRGRRSARPRRCVTGTATVLESRRARPAAVPRAAWRTSLPPQCGGPDIVGWDWATRRGRGVRQRHHVGRLHRRRHLRRRHVHPHGAGGRARSTEDREPVAARVLHAVPGAGRRVGRDRSRHHDAGHPGRGDGGGAIGARLLRGVGRPVDQPVLRRRRDSGRRRTGDERSHAPHRERSLHRGRRRARGGPARALRRAAVRERGRSCTEAELLPHPGGARTIGTTCSWSSGDTIDERVELGVVGRRRPAGRDRTSATARASSTCSRRCTRAERCATSRWRCTWSPCSRASPRGHPRGRCPTPSRLRRGPPGPTRCPC